MCLDLIKVDEPKVAGKKFPQATGLTELQSESGFIAESVVTFMRCGHDLRMRGEGTMAQVREGINGKELSIGRIKQFFMAKFRKNALTNGCPICQGAHHVN